MRHPLKLWFHFENHSNWSKYVNKYKAWISFWWLSICFLEKKHEKAWFTRKYPYLQNNLQTYLASDIVQFPTFFWLSHRPSLSYFIFLVCKNFKSYKICVKCSLQWSYNLRDAIENSGLDVFNVSKMRSRQMQNTGVIQFKVLTTLPITSSWI